MHVCLGCVGVCVVCGVECEGVCGVSLYLGSACVWCVLVSVGVWVWGASVLEIVCVWCVYVSVSKYVW